MITLLSLLYDNPQHSPFDVVCMVRLLELGRPWWRVEYGSEGENGTFLTPNICLLWKHEWILGGTLITPLFLLPECLEKTTLDPFLLDPFVLNAFWDSITWVIWRERTGKKKITLFLTLLSPKCPLSSIVTWVAPFISLLTSVVTVFHFS